MVPNSQYVSICLLVASFRVGNEIPEKIYSEHLKVEEMSGSSFASRCRLPYLACGNKNQVCYGK